MEARIQPMGVFWRQIPSLDHAGYTAHANGVCYDESFHMCYLLAEKQGPLKDYVGIERGYFGPAQYDDWIWNHVHNRCNFHFDDSNSTM